jgi:hypothetical protein
LCAIITYAIQKRILILVILAEGMLEPKRQHDEPRIAVRQLQQPAAEPILRICHVRLLQHLPPPVLELF